MATDFMYLKMGLDNVIPKIVVSLSIRCGVGNVFAMLK